MHAPVTRHAALLLVPLLFAVVALAACKKPRDPASPAEMREKLRTPAAWAMGKVDATEVQRTRIDGVLDALAPELFGFQNDSKALQRELMAALDAPVVDAAVLARLEDQGVRQFDRYMKRLVRVATDLAAILTVEQRRKLVGIWRSWENGERVF